MPRRMLVIIVTFFALLGSVPAGCPAQRVLTPADYTQIQQRYARYNDAIDSGDVEAFAAIFTLTGRSTIFMVMMRW